MLQRIQPCSLFLRNFSRVKTDERQTLNLVYDCVHSTDVHSERVDVIDHAGGRILCVADIRGG